MNTFLAMLNSHPTGALDAGIDRYLQANLERSGNCAEQVFQNIRGSESSDTQGCSRYILMSSLADRMVPVGGLSIERLDMKVNSLYVPLVVALFHFSATA